MLPRSQLILLVSKALLTLTSWLPLPLNHRLGRLVGLAAWRFNTRARQVTDINLALCFPDLSDHHRAELAKKSLIETGKALSETGWMWRRSVADLKQLTCEQYGLEVVEDAMASGEGVIMITPHIGAWEYCSLALSEFQQATAMYRQPRQVWLEPIIVGARERVGLALAPLSQAGIRQAVRILKQGGTLGILPDQEPDPANGVFVPLFGVQANTMTLLARLARLTRARIIMQICVRRPDSKGYDLHFYDIDKTLGDADLQVATTALNQTLETTIREFPEQYLWSYKRFSLLPDGNRRDYRRR